MIAVKLVLMYPCKAVSDFWVRGQKISVIDLNPATRVVVLTNARGTIVTHAYFDLPELIKIVVATHKATDARS